MGFGPSRKFPMAGMVPPSQFAPMGMLQEPGQVTTGMAPPQMPQQPSASPIQAPKDRGMFGRFAGILAGKPYGDAQMGWVERLGRGPEGMNAVRDEMRADRKTQEQTAQAEAQRQQMLQQLGGMPGVTDQQRTFLGMGLGVDQMTNQAFAPPAPPQDPFVINDRVIDRSDPTRMIADYSDPAAQSFKQVTTEDGIFEYIEGQPDSMRFLGKAPAGSPLVSVNTGDGPQENAFMKEAGSLEAKNFGSLVEMGQTSRRNRVILDQLDSSAAAIPGGLEAVVKNELGNLGIPTDGLSEIQATEALINQLVPAQRQPGSGPMSDRDLALFKASLPRLIQTPEGKTRILTNMKAINDYVISEGEIGSRVLSGRISPDQGRAEMQALGNPLAGDPRTGAPTSPQSPDLMGLMAPDGNPVTEDDIGETMRKYGVTREQVIAHLRGQ